MLGYQPGMNLRALVTMLLFAFFVLLPVYAMLTDSPYLVIQFTRILIFALAAVGLNLALGYGGMVSFGHAMYIGIGAYCVAITSFYGYDNGVLHLVLVGLVTALIAIPVGLIALRTRGIAFIMITLALAQMFYYLIVAMRQYGGNQGLPIDQLSNFGHLTGNNIALYAAVLVALVIALLALHRIIRSRFGLILRATSLDDRRVRAVGTTPLGYQLLGYVLSAELCALAGYFLANLTSFASPAYMTWTASGQLIIMVLLGGMGTLVGPVVGAAAFLLLEDVLKGLTDHWLAVMGPIIVLIVVFLSNGLWGALGNRDNSGNH